MKETKVFHNLYEFIVFFVFVFAFPVGSVLAQMALSDKTMYITFFITSMGLTFNYLGFLFGNPCVRLWVEAVILGIVLVINAFISIFKLLTIVPQKSVEYQLYDVLIVVLLILLPMCFYIYEGILLGKEEYKEKKQKDLQYNNERKQEDSQKGIDDTSLTKGGSDV